MTDKPVQLDVLEVENAMRIKAARIEFGEKPLYVFGGKNRQGKSTLLKIIAFLLGGEKFRPTNIKRDDSLSLPEMRATLSNGLVVERKGKNQSLKVTDPSGKAYGQALLKKFYHVLALDLSGFLNAKAEEKLEYFLQVIGVGDELSRLDQEEDKLYNQRKEVGRIADRKKKHAEELLYYPDAPEKPLSASDLIREQQDILEQNSKNRNMRSNVDLYEGKEEALDRKIRLLHKELKEALAEQQEVREYLQEAREWVEKHEDKTTVEIEEKIRKIESINAQVRANLDKTNANEEADQYQTEYDEFTTKIDETRADKLKLLDDADMPLPDLNVKSGELLYRGKAWDCMAGSEQLIVATSIVRKLNPNCGFVLLDKAEALDLDTLKVFEEWLNRAGLQAIATRVSEGDECSILIEDGYTVKNGEKTLTIGEF